MQTEAAASRNLRGPPRRVSTIAGGRNGSVIRLSLTFRMASLLQILLALLVVNALIVFRFWQDKQRAIAGGRRVPEGSLLGLALIGGSPGALLARQWFRHKTRKEPFSSQLQGIVVVQAAILVGLAVAFI